MINFVTSNMKISTTLILVFKGSKNINILCKIDKKKTVLDIFTVKIPIGPAVSKISWDNHTDRHTDS